MRFYFNTAIFDMDGTIFENYIDWQAVRKQLKIRCKNSILEEIFFKGVFNKKKLDQLEKIEMENTFKTMPFAWFDKFLLKLKKKGVNTALITNNNKKNTDYLLNKFSIDFDIVIPREMKMWKPGSNAFHYVCKYFNTIPKDTISIGDSIYDIMASKGSGIEKIFIKKSSNLNRTMVDGVIYFKDYISLYKQIFI